MEHVLAIHTPLRLECCKCSVQSGLRVDWKAPSPPSRCAMASDTFSSMMQLAVKFEAALSDVLEYDSVLSLSLDEPETI